MIRVANCHEGSSPLTRGKPRCRPGWLGQEGLIPAHAGKTGSGSSDATRPGAHPRSRGENDGDEADPMSIHGSSPLTRGKQALSEDGGFARGLIPAHAGKTPPTPTDATRSLAHPRSRGENSKTQIGAHAPMGSSPLTRGKHPRSMTAVYRAGLIPAHAGKTELILYGCKPFRAHPRSRGENRIRARSAISSAGSSPLTRGKPRQPRRTPRVDRLIPAHAGKTG